jgi:hypothetical protein
MTMLLEAYCMIPAAVNGDENSSVQAEIQFEENED